MTDSLFPIELKAIGETGEIEGYASTFGNRDLAGDIVLPGAFTKSLGGRGAGAVAMLWGHDQKRPIGVWTEIKEDGQGLRVKGRILTATRDGADAFEFAKAGAVGGLSIGYRTTRARQDRERKARLLEAVDLHEISLVAIPANPLSRVERVKSHCPDRARRIVAQLNAAAAALRA
ncbi:HK97 family phage prohead protease [Brevundimonas bullata]|uniref:HK97 family phage prohead protease n=1 Tax=Brevundimonas bullata TaxID=13160 RepID=UPI000E0BF836|nr:HK97 family phage prohead protease [Brevundimonas bullata]WQE36722.1 HK97 family phage prohead protease [Brevundimonas bullata]